MSRNFYRAGAAVITALAVNGCSDSSAPVAPLSPDTAPLTSVNTAATTYGGRAWALQVRVPSLGVNQRVSDTGPLPMGGGTRKNAVLAFSIPTLLQLELLSASTSGGSKVATSQAKVNRTKLFVFGHVILVEVVQAFSKAQCVRGAPVKNGSTVIIGLTVDGQGVIVTGAPNQTVPLSGGGVLVINEQMTTANGITVNGLHIKEQNGGPLNVIVSHAQSSITCS